MHSRAYQQFLKEAEAEGREKADGFDKNVLLSLTGEERASASKLLLKLARQGDDTAIDALEVYDSDEVRSSLASILTELPCPSRAHSEAAFVLWKITGDPDYEEALLKDLAEPYGVFRFVTINHLAETAGSEATIKSLKRVLQHDPEKLCCGAAARALLHFAGHWPDLNSRPAGLHEIIRGLWHDDRQKREPAVAKVLELVGE